MKKKIKKKIVAISIFIITAVLMRELSSAPFYFSLSVRFKSTNITNIQSNHNVIISIARTTNSTTTTATLSYLLVERTRSRCFVFSKITTVTILWVFNFQALHNRQIICRRNVNNEKNIVISPLSEKWKWANALSFLFQANLIWCSADYLSSKGNPLRSVV